MLWGWGGGVGRSWFVREGLGWVVWGWSVMVCAFGLGWSCVVLEGLGWGWSVGVWVGGWRWSVVVCAFGYGVRGLGLVGRSLCVKVWGW